MTYEEVKRIRNSPSSEDVDNDELSRMIDKAIDKQIPKKPYEETIATEEGYMTKKRSFFFCCPNCFCHLNENQKHCDDCGQKLDWSDSE